MHGPCFGYVEVKFGVMAALPHCNENHIFFSSHFQVENSPKLCYKLFFLHTKTSYGHLHNPKM